MAKILVIDDSPTVVGLVKEILEEENHEVLTAFDGEEGLKTARKESPQLIILDIMVPKIDGFKVCRLLKFDDKYKHIPIIMFTAKTGDEDREISLEVCADEYITKDFEPKKLIEVVNKHLSK